MTRAEVADRGQGRADLPRRDRRARCSHLRERHGARLPLLLMNSFATRDDTLAALERYPELAVDDLPLDFVQGKVPKLRADDLDAGRLAGRPRRSSGPARPRRRLHVAATSGMLDAAAGARLPLRVPVELGQPRRGARPAHPRAGSRREGLPFVMEVDRPHGGRPQGRPPGAPARGRRAGAARDRADARRGPGRVRGHRRATATSTRTTSGSTCAALRALLEERDGVLGPADDRQPQDGRPDRRVVARGDPARDGDGRGDRRVRGRAARSGAAHALRAGEDDQRPARGALRRLRAGATTGRVRPGGRPDRRVVELDAEHYKLLGRLRVALRRAAPSLRDVPAARRCAATSRSAATWTCAAGSRSRPLERAASSRPTAAVLEG